MPLSNNSNIAASRISFKQFRSVNDWYDRLFCIYYEIDVVNYCLLDALVLGCVPGAGLGVITPPHTAVVHTLVHQTPELVTEHRAVAVVQAPDVLGGARPLL